jgi:hypothetical protein
VQIRLFSDAQLPRNVALDAPEWKNHARVNVNFNSKNKRKEV